jgi:ATP-dependent exoDNAse (exonuclease V) beta subunit
MDKPEIERLIYLFNRFNEVYEKNKKLTNAINYHYLLSKLLPLIQRPDVVPHLYRIRNPRKLKEHDKTINLVFTELEWV